MSPRCRKVGRKTHGPFRRVSGSGKARMKRPCRMCIRPARLGQRPEHRWREVQKRSICAAMWLQCAFEREETGFSAMRFIWLFIAFFAFAAIICIAVTPLVRSLAMRFGLVDVPDGRRKMQLRGRSRSPAVWPSSSPPCRAGVAVRLCRSDQIDSGRPERRIGARSGRHLRLGIDRADDRGVHYRPGRRGRRSGWTSRSHQVTRTVAGGCRRHFQRRRRGTAFDFRCVVGITLVFDSATAFWLLGAIIF